MAASPILLIFKAIDQASPVVRNLVGDLKKNFEVVGQLSFAYNNVTQTIQQFAAQGQKAYQLLIGQNVELQNQLLSTQATLVATNKVIADGVEVSDPGKAIQALTEPVNQAIAQLRQGSLELVGVTSAQLIPLFQITAQSSASIGASLSDSADLTLSFAAALGTLKIPLDQARQELNSIYTAQITSDSQLAKSLGLNNQMVNQWKAQGVLVERLTERLGAFRAGNAIQAATIDGVTSNIEELASEIGRIAGAPLLEPIVQQLDLVYKFLEQNKDTIQQIAVNAVNFFLDIGNRLGEAIKTLEPALKQLFGALFTQLGNEAGAAAAVINLIVDAFVALLKASEPLIQILANATSALAQFTSTDIGGLVLQATLLAGLLAQFTPALIAIQAGFIKAAAGAILFTSAANGSTAALAILSTVSPTLAAIAASYATAGGGAIGFAAALGTATASFKAFAVAAGAALAPLLPLIALGGAISVALVIKQTGDLKQANEELEEFRQQNDLLGDESIRLATKLKVLNDLERANGKLSEEEAKRRRGLQQITKGQTGALQAQIEAIKQVRPANEEQRRNQEAQIAQLQRLVDLLNKQSGGVKLLAQDLPQLGNDYEQLSKKVEDALAQFERPVSADQFNASSKEIVALSAQQFELGKLNAEQAIAQLNRVRNDTRVDLELRLSAQQAITKIRQQEIDERVKASEDEQQKIQALIAGEEISQAEGQRRITEVKLQQLKIQLEATKAAIASENALRQQQVTQQVAAIDKQILEAEGRRQKAERAGDKGGVRIAKEDIARLESQKSAAQQSLEIDNERLNQLKSQQQKFTTEIAQTESQERQRIRQERIKDFDEQQAVLESQNARRLITEAEFNQRSLELTRARGQAELQQLAEQRAKLSPDDKEGLEAIASREAVIRKQIAEATEKFEQQKQAARVAAIEVEQRQLAVSLASGLLTQEQFNEQSLKLTQTRLQAELDEVQRQRSRLKAGDTERLNELIAQEADIQKRQLEAQSQFQEQQLQLLEQNQRQATDAITQSEVERLTEIARLEADKTIRRVEAEQLRVDLTRDRIQEEIRLEKERIAELERLPAFGDPTREEQRQAQIRASRIKTSQLTKSLIDNEVQQRNALFRVVEDKINRQTQDIQNAATAQTQALERERQQRDLLSRSVETQNRLLQARKELVSSIAGVLQGEIGILQETTKREREKKKLAETAAEIRLKAVREQAKIEKEILELNIQQKETALEQEQLQLRIQEIQARAATLSAQADQQKVAANPEATAQEIEAARLRVEAAIASEVGLQAKGLLLDQQRQLNQREAGQQRDRLSRESQLQDDQARMGLAQSRTRRGQGRREARQLRNEILRRRGATSARDFGRNTNFSNLGNEALPDPQLQQKIAQLEAQLRQQSGLPALVPQAKTKVIATGGTPPQGTEQTKMNEALEAIASSQKPVGTVEINITNQFTGNEAENGKAADALTQRIRKELFDLGTLLTR